LWVFTAVLLAATALYKVIRWKSTFRYDAQMLELDKALYHKIKSEILPQDHLISWLREKDFGVGFDYKYISDLGKIIEENRHPDFQFFHPQLEKRKVQLVAAVADLLEAMNSYLFGNEDGLLSVPPEWEYRQPERYYEALSALSEKSGQVCNCFDDLIRTGRRLMKI
jgi:hypothetical protein